VVTVEYGYVSEKGLEGWKAGPVLLMARKVLIVVRQGKCSVCLLSTRPDPIDQLLSGVQMKASFVEGQTRSPRRRSWHRRPKFVGLLFGKVYQEWPPGLDLLRLRGVVIAKKVPRRRRCRREASTLKLPLRSDRVGTGRQDPSTASKRSIGAFIRYTSPTGA
jgi:hypothetical protein